MTEFQDAGRTLIVGGLVLDAARNAPERLDILLEGNRIVDLFSSTPAGLDGVRRLDATNRLVIPGLVNAHTHSHFTFGKGVNPNWSLELHQNATPGVTGGQRAEDLHLCAQLAAAEMVLKGCTSCYDLVVQLPFPTDEGTGAIVSGYEAVGLRAVVALTIADQTIWKAIPGLLASLPTESQRLVNEIVAAPFDATLSACQRQLRQWPARSELVRPAIAPTIPFLCSADFIRGAQRLAEAYGAPLHTHLAESKVQARVALARFDRSLVAHLETLGYLGPNLTVAHAIWADKDDIRRLAAHGVSVAHCPTSNMRLGNGIAPVREMVDSGINVGIGTDACTCSDQLNMFEAMRLASFASRIRSADFTRWLSAAQVMRMATMGGGSALGLGNVGAIRLGYLADLVLLDLDHINYVPLNDALTQLVFGENGAAVASVVINGELVLNEGCFTRIDYPTLITRVRASNERLREENAKRAAEFRAIEPLVGAFCIGLAREPHHVNRYLDSN